MEKVYYNTLVKPVADADNFNTAMIYAIDDGWELVSFNMTERAGREGTIYMVALFKRVVSQNVEAPVMEAEE